MVPVIVERPDQPGHYRPRTASKQKRERYLSGAWTEPPPQHLQSMVAVPPPGGGGTTARAKLVSDKIQRYNRSRERYNRWAETVSRKDRGRDKEKLSLSLTPEEDKGGVMNVYVKRFPQCFLMRIPS